jgi:hypothetical protein
MKCPVCGKSKSAFEMRPIVNVDELKVGAAMSEEKSEQDVAGAKVDVVCRDCWMALLKERSKEEVIEILETICGVLMEADNRMKERTPSFDFREIIEKHGVSSPGVQIQPMPLIQPYGGGGPGGISVPPNTPIHIQPWNGTNFTKWEGGASHVTMGSPGNVTISNGFKTWYDSFHKGDDGVSLSVSNDPGD